MKIHLKAIIFFLISIAFFLLWILFKDPILIGLFLAIFISLFLEAVNTILSLTKVEFSRSSYTNRHKVGEVFKETFVITNNSKFRKHIIQIEDKSKFGEFINSRVVSNFPAKSHRTFKSSVILLNRGVFDIGPTIITTESILGLFSISKVIKPKKKLVVFPYIFTIDKIDERASISVKGGKKVQTYSKNITPLSAGIREYFPSDPLHRIHWPLSLKHRKIMVKEFDEDSRSQIWILVDSSKKSNNGFPKINIAKKTPYMTLKNSLDESSLLARSSFEYSVCIAASLASFYSKMGKSVGLTTVGKKVINIQPDFGQRQLLNILGELSTLERAGTIDIFSIFERIKTQISKGSKVFLITDDEFVDFTNLLRIAELKKFKITPVYINRMSFQNIEKTQEKIISPLESKLPIISINYRDNLREKFIKDKVI